jgi:AraC-like DNA-binding protein
VPRGHENVFLGNERILHFLNTLEEEAARADTDHEKMFERALNMLLISTYRDLQAGRFLQRPDEYGESNLRGQGQDPIVRAQAYIKSHLARTLTVEMVANAVYMSETHFRRRFLAETGYTLTAFINFHRLEQAKHFLRETDWSVSQIREFIGYRSDAYLHTLFRRHFNISPTEFRNVGQPKEGGKASGEGVRPRKKAN